MSYALTMGALVPLAVAACALVGFRLVARNQQPIRNPVFKRMRATWRRRAVLAWRAVAGKAPREAQVALDGMPPRPIHTTISPAGPVPPLLFSIGREACRERVGQFVWLT